MSEQEYVAELAFWTFLQWYCYAVGAAYSLFFAVEMFRNRNRS
jgi:hypothetical protein